MKNLKALMNSINLDSDCARIPTKADRSCANLFQKKATSLGWVNK